MVSGRGTRRPVTSRALLFETQMLGLDKPGRKGSGHSLSGKTQSGLRVSDTSPDMGRWGGGRGLEGEGHEWGQTVTSTVVLWAVFTELSCRGHQG